MTANARPAQPTVCRYSPFGDILLKFTWTKSLTQFRPALVAVVPKDKLTINGPVKTWTGTAASGNKVDRLFCSECGSPIAHDPSAAPEIIVLKAGTLDTEIKKNLKPVSFITLEIRRTFGSNLL